jgi:hypothetical protein
MQENRTWVLRLRWLLQSHTRRKNTSGQTGGTIGFYVLPSALGTVPCLFSKTAKGGFNATYAYAVDICGRNDMGGERRRGFI